MFSYILGNVESSYFLSSTHRYFCCCRAVQYDHIV